MHTNSSFVLDPFPNDEDLGGVLIPPTLQGPFINTSQDEFDVSKIKQPVRNINCLMAPKGKLTAKKKKTYTEAIKNYENIVNWSILDENSITENIQKGRSHL